MWQKFTERARRVILLGQEEAVEMNFGYVGTEHLLLGLVRETEGVAAQFLAKRGLTTERVRQEIQSRVQPDEGTSVEPKLTSRAKRVLELAADESRRMRHPYIGTEHLLLGLLREKEGLAAIVLRHLGLDLESVRRQVLEYSGKPRGTSSNHYRATIDVALAPAVKYLLEVAQLEAHNHGQTEVHLEHFLLALLREEIVSIPVLRECGLDTEKAIQLLQQQLQQKNLDDAGNAP